MCEGFGLGSGDGISSVSDHGDVLTSAGQWASPMAGTGEPDLQQQLSSSCSLGIFPIEDPKGPDLSIGTGFPGKWSHHPWKSLKKEYVCHFTIWFSGYDAV